MQPISKKQYDQLSVTIYPSNEALGQAAAHAARQIIQAAIAERDAANIIIATGNSQLTFLHALRDLDGIEWDKVTVFHMDEYVGIDPQHPASFPLFLRQHILDKVKPGKFIQCPAKWTMSIKPVLTMHSYCMNIQQIWWRWVGAKMGILPLTIRLTPISTIQSG